MKLAGKKRINISSFSDGTFIIILVSLAAVMSVMYSLLSPAPNFEIDKSSVHKNTKGKTPSAKPVPKKAIRYSKKTIKKSYPFDLKRPHFVLDKLGHVASSQVDAATLKKSWSGKDDLSIKAWLGVDDKLLKLRVEVVDDIANRGNIPNEMWNFDSLQVAINHPKLKLQYEFGFGMDDEGRRMRALWMMPTQYAKEKSETLNSIDFEISKKDNNMLVYEIAIPYEMLHLTRKDIADGIRFNFIVNDLDKDGDESRYWMELSPGIGQNKNSAYFPEIKLP